MRQPMYCPRTCVLIVLVPLCFSVLGEPVLIDGVPPMRCGMPQDHAPITCPQAALGSLHTALEKTQQ